jgi:hypothetical protein
MAPAPGIVNDLPRADLPVPHPLGTLHLLGLRRPGLDTALTLALLAALLVSRLAVLPASIWEQDEAYFAAAVARFEPLHNQPHPPWFPLWIVLGKLATVLVADPARALCWCSLVASVWMLFPLSAAWSLVLERRHAVAASALFLVLPGPWLLSARAFSGTCATAFLALAVASLWSPVPRRRLLTGALAAAACVLVRPHLAVAVVPVVAVAAFRARGWGERLRLVAPLLLGVALTAGWIVVEAGGLRPLATALSDHAMLHFSQLRAFEYRFADSGLARALVVPWVAVAWIAVAAWGVRSLLLTRRPAENVIPLLGAVLAPLLVLVFAASNPTHTRYTVPVLAMSSGLVVAAASSLLRARAAAAGIIAVAAACWQVLPAAAVLRRDLSPPVASVRHALGTARETGAVVVVDRTLVAFVRLELERRPSGATLLWAYQVAQGETPPPPPALTAFVFDHGHGGLLSTADRRTTYSVSSPLLRRIAQDRFLDVTVAEGAVLRPARPPPG